MLTEEELNHVSLEIELKEKIVMAKTPNDGIVQVDISSLKPHPQNAMIYGYDDVSDL